MNLHAMGLCGVLAVSALGCGAGRSALDDLGATGLDPGAGGSGDSTNAGGDTTPHRGSGGALGTSEGPKRGAGGDSSLSGHQGGHGGAADPSPVDPGLIGSGGHGGAYAVGGEGGGGGSSPQQDAELTAGGGSTGGGSASDGGGGATGSGGAPSALGGAGSASAPPPTSFAEPGSFLATRPPECAACMALECNSTCLGSATCTEGATCALTCEGGARPRGQRQTAKVLACMAGCFGGDYTQVTNALSAVRCLQRNCLTFCK